MGWVLIILGVVGLNVVMASLGKVGSKRAWRGAFERVNPKYKGLGKEGETARKLTIRYVDSDYGNALKELDKEFPGG
ncbi:MAG: hypothetical protein ABIJ86_06700 [Spirochaetota bacterium]